jgi:hypothetical protein
MKVFENIPLFQYGVSANGFYISKEVVEKCIDTFQMQPVMAYQEDDRYNKNNYPIGIITEITDIKDNFVYGNISIAKDEDIDKFINYGIQVDETHQEGDIWVIDKFTLMDVSFDLKIM